MRIIHISKYFLVLLSCFGSVSFQVPKTSKIEIKNLGLSSAESAKVQLALTKEDILKLTFRDRNNNIIIDKNSNFTIKKIPSLEVIQSGKVGDRISNLNISSNGDYILEVTTKNKKDQFFNVAFEKINGNWLGDKAPVAVKSSLLEAPSKDLSNKLCISYPVSKNTITALVGEGKNANGITIEVPRFLIKTTMDKGFQQTITESFQLDVFMYLDPENTKSKGVIDRIMALGKKGKTANLSQFCEVKTFISESKQADISDNLLSSKPSGSASSGSGEFPKTSEKPMSIAEMNKLNEQTRMEQEESLKLFGESLASALKPEQKTILVQNPEDRIIQNLPCQFDFTEANKRKCKPVPNINGSESQFFSYWVGVNQELFQTYRAVAQQYKNIDRLNNSTPLSEYSNAVYFQKSIHDRADNTEIRPFPFRNDEPSFDNVEIALVDDINRQLFESSQNYSSITSGLLGNTGQLFGFKSITSNSQMYLCSCNHNKQSPVSIYAIFETYTLPQIQ